MIGKCAVLLRVEYFKQCRSRVASEITAYLVHLIEKEQRIVLSGIYYVVYDSARDGSDISTPVSSYLSFVSYTTEGHPYELPAGSSCY